MSITNTQNWAYEMVFVKIADRSGTAYAAAVMRNVMAEAGFDPHLFSEVDIEAWICRYSLFADQPMKENQP